MRISLANLLLIFPIVALALAVVSQRRQLALGLERQREQSAQIQELSTRLEKLNGYGKVQNRMNDLIATLDLDDEKDSETFRLVQNLMPRAPSPQDVEIDESWRSSFQQLIDVNGEGRLEVLSLKHRYLGGGGHSGPLPSQYSVNALFNGVDLIEVLTLGFDVEFVDYNGDGTIDLSARKQHGFDKGVTHYEIKPSGFTRIADGGLAE